MGEKNDQVQIFHLINDAYKQHQVQKDLDASQKNIEDFLIGDVKMSRRLSF